MYGKLSWTSGIHVFSMLVISSKENIKVVRIHHSVHLVNWTFYLKNIVTDVKNLPMRTQRHIWQNKQEHAQNPSLGLERDPRCFLYPRSEDFLAVLHLDDRYGVRSVVANLIKLVRPKPVPRCAIQQFESMRNP